MKLKNLIRVTCLTMATILCTVAAGLGVWSTAQNTLTATENIAFTADKYVDATITIAINGVTDKVLTFEETLNSDDTQTAAISDINGESTSWVTDGSGSDIARQVVITFTIQNTSTHYDLTVAFSGVAAMSTDDAKITLDTNASSASVEITKGSTKVFTYTYWVSGLADKDFGAQNWTCTMTAHK